MEADQGVEPRFAGSEPAVLPLNESAKMVPAVWNRTDVGGLQNRSPATERCRPWGDVSVSIRSKAESQSAGFACSLTSPFGVPPGDRTLLCGFADRRPDYLARGTGWHGRRVSNSLGQVLETCRQAAARPQWLLAEDSNPERPA